MRRTVIQGGVACARYLGRVAMLTLAVGAAQNFPVAPRHHHRAVLRRRSVGCDGADSRRAHEGHARRSRAGRERHRGGRHRSASAARCARRPTATRSASAISAPTSPTARSTSSATTSSTDLEPVALLPSNPMIIVSKNEVPANDAEGIDRLAEGATVAADGRHRGRGLRKPYRRALFRERSTGIKLQYVPYRGTGPAMNDLVAGQIDLIVDQTSNSLAAGARRQYPRLCHHRRQARRVGARHSDRRRSRPAGIPHDAVVRAVGAQGTRRRTSSQS